ncbi:efflux RND transporter periplasmic adaptor subunit [Deinococcus arcticus]|uniref:Efflux transporter periplasmic adaptor subunit n=1 Tax=Deinococcus arcticus TaxID=2136176 RepID=A0A2T3W9C7_9DEIO|nr:efflux RND transporter periplasmic adaptor subunit [Deinococcus arcticus]PTA68511.1 efflux transporter periplasmic adaptor subunit [Deinococcus arcticus]
MRALLPLTLPLLLAACAPPGGTGPTNDIDAPPAKTTALQVTTVTATAGTLQAQRSASATLQAQRDSQVAAQSGGAVRAVPVQEGERVQPGQVVVQLDDLPQRQALDNARLQLQQAQLSLEQTQRTAQGAGASLRAAVQAAEATLAQARSSAQSAERLYALGGVSQADLQAARSALAQAESGLAQARSNLSQNGQSAQNSVPLARVTLAQAQAGVRQAEENLARTAVRAPFAGTVADLGVEVGEFVAQGSPVFRLVDPGSLRAQFSVPAADAATLRPGTPLNLGYGGQNYVATVVDTPGIAGTNRLVPVTARVQGGGALPVGATAQARYRVTLGRGVLVPASAVQAEEGQNVVYVAAAGVAQRTPVTVVAESGAQVAVQGLDAGQAVITPLPASLQDGARVRVTRPAGARP